MTRDPLRPALQTGVYVLFYVVAVYLFSPLLSWAGGYLIGLTVTGLLAAAIANLLCMRIYEGRELEDLGMPLNRMASWNLGVGLLVGLLAAALVLGGPVLARAAHFAPVAGSGANWRTVLFVPVLLLCGAAGEELLFRGYGFQVLLRRFGPFATVLPIGVIFGLLHGSNPHASPLALVNTAGFGILFGCAFLRTHDLWLPLGMHVGWNVTLPVFGVNLSGITMRVTGYELVWKASPWWTGGDYGPEASVLTSAVLVLLLILIWKLPVIRQANFLLDDPANALGLAGANEEGDAKADAGGDR